MIEHKKYRQHSGSMDSRGAPYPGVREALKESSDQMYQFATREI